LADTAEAGLAQGKLKSKQIKEQVCWGMSYRQIKEWVALLWSRY